MEGGGWQIPAIARVYTVIWVQNLNFVTFPKMLLVIYPQSLTKYINFLGLFHALVSQGTTQEVLWRIFSNANDLGIWEYCSEYFLCSACITNGLHRLIYLLYSSQT